jgi:hypothetical protein
MLTQNNYLKKVISIFVVFSFFFIFLYFFIYYFDSKKKINSLSLYKISKYYENFDNWSMYKYNLLKSKNYNQYIFGTSTALEYKPYELNEKYSLNTINLSFPGTKIEHIYLFLKEILKKNKNVENIIIDLKYHMFSDRKTSLNIPFSLTEKKLFNFLKVMKTGDFKFYTNYLFESLKLKIFKNETSKMNENFIYGSRLNNAKENFDFNLNLPPVKIIKGEIDETQIYYFKKISEILNEKNIKLTVFFSPYTSTFLEFNNLELLKKEEKLKNILKNIHKKIYEFKNNSIIYDDLFFYDHLHYNHKIASIITDCIFFSSCDDKYIQFIK